MQRGARDVSLAESVDLGAEISHLIGRLECVSHELFSARRDSWADVKGVEVPFRLAKARLKTCQTTPAPSDQSFYVPSWLETAAGSRPRWPALAVLTKSR